MRSYNYVVEITHDFDDVQYRIRSIDFDQQCYEGKRTFYLPQFFKENNVLVNLAGEVLNERTIHQYQIEERSRLLRRMKHSHDILEDLLTTMERETLSTDEKIKQLADELSKFHSDTAFLQCTNMASVLRQQLSHLGKQN